MVVLYDRCSALRVRSVVDYLTTYHNCYSCDAVRIRHICIAYMCVLSKYLRYNICISYTLPYLEEGASH